MAEEKSVPPADEKSQEVDRIRDIIFGSQMRTYEGHFQTIQRDLERLQQEIDRLNEELAEMEKNHSQKLQALERQMRGGDDNLRMELRETAQRLMDEKVDRQMLGDLLIELGNQMKTARSYTASIEGLIESKED